MPDNCVQGWHKVALLSSVSAGLASQIMLPSQDTSSSCLSGACSIQDALRRQVDLERRETDLAPGSHALLVLLAQFHLALLLGTLLSIARHLLRQCRPHLRLLFRQPPRPQLPPYLHKYHPYSEEGLPKEFPRRG